MKKKPKKKVASKKMMPGMPMMDINEMVYDMSLKKPVEKKKPVAKKKRK